MINLDTVIRVADSKPGWAKVLRELIALLYAGHVPTWDVSEIREAGAKLKIMGGRASGPQPLLDLFDFVVKVFKKASGRRLFPIECHDIMCKIGEVVVVGGVRRSALISLSNLNDDQMAHAKSGQWWETEPQRALANNSVAYKSKPEMGTFMREWLALYDSKSGERGMFNREAADKQVARNGRREQGHMWGTNPCSEIILRGYQFCNLSEVVVRETDSLNDLKRKVRLATILGTLQSTLTDFKYLRKVWKDKHRGRAFVRRILDWYHGSSRAFKERRQQALARRNASRSGRYKSEICEHAWNTSECSNHLCKAVGYCISTRGRS